MLKCEETSLLNGQINCTNNNYYESNCYYKCNEGYKITGNSERKCIVDENGIISWNNDQPICTSSYTFIFMLY